MPQGCAAQQPTLVPPSAAQPGSYNYINPDTALDVIRQSGAFQCYAEGSASDLAIPLGQSSRIAEALVYDEPLPPPSFPELEYALFFFGLPWQNEPYLPAGSAANLIANTIPRDIVVNYFANAGIVNIPSGTLNGTYLGHGPTNSNRFGTFFFSDDPSFTGFIP
ncbi:hypothetical protein HC928_04935 [bacterium]|nr:hypothetical protein [bacterium]